MPANTLLTGSVVQVAEDFEDKVYNFRPSDTPLVSGINRTSVSNVLHEWTADVYRAANGANAAIEGADATYSAQTQPEVYSNRTQIIQDTISVSNTSERVKKYGRASEVARLKTKKMVELKLDIEAAAIGGATAVTGTSGVAAKMRGLYGWIATNNDLSTGTPAGVAPNPLTNTAPTAGQARAITETMLKGVIQKVYQEGGDASTILVSPAHKVALSAFIGNVQRTNEVGGSAGNKRLNTAFTFYGHDFGDSQVVPDRVMSTGTGLANTVYIVDYDKIALGQLRPFETEQMATVGDAKNWQVRTEVTLVVRQESTLGAVRDLS